MSIFDKGFLTILGCAALLVRVAIPLVLRKIPRNIAYGFRTRATMPVEGAGHFVAVNAAVELFGIAAEKPGA